MRRRVEIEPGLVFETCDPEPKSEETRKAIEDIVRAAARQFALHPQTEEDANG